MNDMHIKSNEKKENSTVELVIEVGADEFNAAIDKVYKRQRKNISLPGWRKGKAPRKMIEAMYGAQVFYEDAIEEAYPDAYYKALDEAGIESVAYPKLEVQQVGKDGFTFKAVVTVSPEAKVSGYKGLTAPKDEVSVSGADVDQEMQTYIDRASRLVSVEREAAKGDTVVINFEGFKDGVPFEGGKAENYSLELGSGAFVPGFEEQLEGAKAGDERDVNVTFPEDYAEELAGAAAVFKVKVLEVKERQQPEIDDEFAKDVSEFDTLEEFRKSLAEDLRRRRQEAADKAFEDELVRQLAEEHLECEIPEAMLEFQTDQRVQEYARNIQMRGVRFEDYLRVTNTDMDQLRAEARESAERGIRVSLALEAVARAEGLEVSEEEKEAEYARLSGEYSMDLEKVKNMIPDKELTHDLQNKKAVELIVNAAQVGPAPAAEKTVGGEESAEEAGEGEEPAAKPAKKPARRSRKAAQPKKDGDGAVEKAEE